MLDCDGALIGSTLLDSPPALLPRNQNVSYESYPSVPSGDATINNIIDLGMDNDSILSDIVKLNNEVEDLSKNC